MMRQYVHTSISINRMMKKEDMIDSSSTGSDSDEQENLVGGGRKSHSKANFQICHTEQ